jgi:multidrug efflux system outer membrane protein
VQGATAQLDAELARYRGQVLVAFKDVEDQLSSLRLLQQQADTQARAVSFATRATTLSESRYRNGMDSQLELLDARRSELRNRREALHVRSSQYQATVGLVRALGGGWARGGLKAAAGLRPRSAGRTYSDRRRENRKLQWLAPPAKVCVLSRWMPCVA